MFKQGVQVTKLDFENIIQVGDKRETAKLVENFYTNNPFPNYDNLETIFDLRNKIESNSFTRNLKNGLGLGKKIIEVGSGTSQLSIALASGTNNFVVAFDPTLESLRLGEKFAKSAGISNCAFVNADMFSNPFKEEYFDVVWCSGVLHHTENPEKGFDIISTWLKPGGYTVIGLYNQYGRMRTGFRQKLFKLLGSGGRAKSIVSQLDPVLRSDISQQKKDAWFQDQYEHPVETWHTLDEVLKWFSKNNIEFISSIPTASGDSVEYSDIFVKQDKGSFITRIISQVGILFSPLGGEGGLFLVIGKKINKEFR
jgi:ubiquinone/menaquinone biosynthesis C-methylase UbiE